MTQFADAAERRRAPGRRLTDRQTAILELVASGLENKEIAYRLGISEQAVKEHVSTLLRLLSAPNRAALGDAAATRRFLGSATVDPEWLRYLFQDAPMQVAIVEGPEHRFVAVNDAYRTTIGGADLIGLRYRDVFPDRLESLAYLDQAYTSGERVVASGLRRRFIRSGGAAPADGFVTFVLQPLPGPSGGTAGVAKFSIDVTEEALARERAEPVDSVELAILDVLAAGVIVSDEHGALVKVNRSARRLLSLPQTPDTLTPEIAPPYALRDAADGRAVPFEELPMIRALRGERVEPRIYLVRDPVQERDRRLQVSALPLLRPDGRIRGSVTTVADA